MHMHAYAYSSSRPDTCGMTNAKDRCLRQTCTHTRTRYVRASRYLHRNVRWHGQIMCGRGTSAAPCVLCLLSPVRTGLRMSAQCDCPRCCWHRHCGTPCGHTPALSSKHGMPISMERSWSCLNHKCPLSLGQAACLSHNSRVRGLRSR